MAGLTRRSCLSSSESPYVPRANLPLTTCTSAGNGATDMDHQDADRDLPEVTGQRIPRCVLRQVLERMWDGFAVGAGEGERPARDQGARTDQDAHVEAPDWRERKQVRASRASSLYRRHQFRFPT